MIRSHVLLALFSVLLAGMVGSPRSLANDGGEPIVRSVTESMEDARGGDIACTSCPTPVACTRCPTPEDTFCNYLPQIGRLRTYGWLDTGFAGNTSSPNDRFNGPYNAVDRSNELMFNQGYLVSEIGLPSDRSLGFGGRVDLLYGEDFFLAQSIGWETNPDGTRRWNSGEYYGLAMPQAYVEAGTADLSVKLGHFYSIVGYEGVMAPYNFFYSKSLSYQFGGPFTHWGGLATWNANEAWQFQFGLHNGWNALDREQDHLGAIVGVKYTNPCHCWWTSFAVTTGAEDNDVAGLKGLAAPIYENRTRYSWIVDVPITCRWEYMFHHWLGFQKEGDINSGDAYWYGIDQYLYYTFNDCWKAGVRFEWFRDDDGTRIGLNRASNLNNPSFFGDLFSLSAGLNWRPTTNLIVRPELRYDWFDGAGLPYADGTKDNQLLLAADVIWRF